MNIDKALCPLCLKKNNCAMEKSPANDQPEHCWCMAENVSEQALTKVPENKKGKACICQRCLKTFS